MTRYLAPFVRSYGTGLRSSLPWLHTNEPRLLEDPPPAYNEICQTPSEVIISTPRFQESPPPDYETAINIPPLEVPLPASTLAQNSRTSENTGKVDRQSRLHSSTHNMAAGTYRMFDPDDPNGVSSEFAICELPGYSSARYTRNGISSTTDARQQLNGITNNVVADNIYTINNQNYISSDSEVSQAICSFIQRVIFTSVVAGVLLYLHIAHTEWMPQWAFVIVICLLFMSVLQHIPPLLKGIQDNRSRNYD